VLNVGRTRRVVTTRQHAALAAQFQTCAMPGCGVRFADCDIHHLIRAIGSVGHPTDSVSGSRWQESTPTTWAG
jgi:hypothetical protein